mmetsp:Transcript_19771/g.30500  ORF Transcript_19771/g.30500 Transcript_19771/m.30500 type:complete len:98 (-) Transcript_19771:88-381(-)
MASLLNNQEALQEQQRKKDELEVLKNSPPSSPNMIRKKKLTGLVTPTSTKENQNFLSRSASKQKSRASRSNSPHRSSATRAKKFEFESSNSKRLITV